MFLCGFLIMRGTMHGVSGVDVTAHGLLEFELYGRASGSFSI
jgi:hypothetical protein